MSWEGSTRRSRLPSDWPRIRSGIIRRDEGKCQVRLANGRKCLAPFSDVDHITPGDDHSPNNLRCICDWHHKRKSAGEGYAAYNAKMAASRRKFRRPRKHPGLK